MSAAAAPAVPQGELAVSRWWRVVGGLLMNLALGSLYAWSVFVAPLEKEFGWKRAYTSQVFTWAVVVFAIAFILAGRLQDRIGPFFVSLVGCILLTVGFLLCAKTTSLTYLIVCFGIVVGIGNGFGYATPIPVMAKWFPDKRGLAVGLAVAAYGGGSAIFGPLANLWLIPTYGWRATFTILGVVFFVMTFLGSFLLKNPPAGYQVPGWVPASKTKVVATAYEFRPEEMLRTPAFYLMWFAYALGCSAGLMLISQLVPFAKSMNIQSAALQSMTLVIGAAGNASGSIFSGWMCDALGRLNVLRLMIGISAVAMPLLYLTGSNVALLYIMVFVVYWCYGTQLSVSASTTSDFWGTKNAGINYGLLFTAWGVAGIIGPKIAGKLFDIYRNYQGASWGAGALGVVAFACVFSAPRSSKPAMAGDTEQLVEPAPRPPPRYRLPYEVDAYEVDAYKLDDFTEAGSQVALEATLPTRGEPEARRSAIAFPTIDPSNEHPVSGEPLTITVRLTDAPSPFVWSEGVVLGETPPETIHTFSVHILFGGTSAWDTLEYSVAGGTSKPAVFRVTTPPLEAGAVRSRVETIVVNFYLGYRWSGEGYRNVEIRADESMLSSKTIPPPDVPEWRRTLSVAPNAEPPDLLVRIQRDPTHPDTYIWTCLSPWEDLRPAAEGDDRMDLVEAERYVKNLWEPKATATLEQLMLRQVEGAGETIYRSTPKVFKDAYWKLHRLAREERRFEFDAIQIVTDEPHVPWELMRLADSERAADLPAEFLSIRHAVGRWVADRSCHLDQTIAIQRLVVLASDYEGTEFEPKLPWVNDERKYLHEKLGAQSCMLQIAPVLEFLEHRDPEAEAAHFACHGQMFPDTPNQSYLTLEDDEKNFTPEVVGRQEVRQGFGAAHPFVFLNACQVGSMGRSLTLVAGFPAAFLQAGASAVVSPLWTVMDQTAQKVTEEFYRLAFGEQPVQLGAALKEIRGKWYRERNLTYLAYVLYGDPKALVVFRPPR